MCFMVGFARHEAGRGITWRGLAEKPCELPLGALGDERKRKSLGASPPPGDLQRKGGVGGNGDDSEVRRCAHEEAG